MKLSGAASPQTNDIVDIAEPEFYCSDHRAKVKDTGLIAEAVKYK